MHPRTDSLGACPDCATTVPRSRAIIEYERGGETAVFAECPGCTAVVRPV